MTHLTQSQLKSLLSGTLPPKERASLLEHALACDDCASLLCEANAALPALAPPPGMEVRILEAAQEKSRRDSLRAYTLRVVAAMAAALILLLTGAFQKLAQLPQGIPQLSQSIQTSISDFIDSTKEAFPLQSKTN